MAGRPHKQGLDYFSFDVDFFDNTKIDQLMETHSASGIIFYQQLLCTIYRKGNFIEWDRTAIRQFCKNFGYKHDQIHLYLSEIIKLGLIHGGMFDRYSILTSDSIQERYLYSTKRREKVIYTNEYLLIDLDTYKAVSHSVEVRDIEGNLVKKYYREVNSKNKKMIKAKAPAAAQPAQAAVTTPAPIATPNLKYQHVVPHISNALKAYTTEDVEAFIAIPYVKRDHDFHEFYKEDEYAGYQWLYKKVNEKYRYIKKSIYQLTFTDYIEFIYECTPTPTLVQLEMAFGLISAGVIQRNTDIYKELAVALEKVWANPEAAPEPDLKAVYVKDEALEKAMQEFWGFNEIKTFKSCVLIHDFCRVMYNTDQLEWLNTQFMDYRKVVDLWGEKFKMTFSKFIGKQSELFTDGKWNDEVWSMRLSEKKNGAATDNKAKQAIDGHSEFMNKIKGGK